MSVGDDELGSLVDKRVNIKFTHDGESHEGQAMLLAYVPRKAILVRLPGIDKPVTIPLDNLHLIELAKFDRAKKVTQRILVQPITTNINSHLADKHNYLLSVINDVPPDMAMRLHTRIDHDDLGHAHSD